MANTVLWKNWGYLESLKTGSTLSWILTIYDKLYSRTHLFLILIIKDSVDKYFLVINKYQWETNVAILSDQLARSYLSIWYIYIHTVSDICEA